MLNHVKNDVVGLLSKVQVQSDEQVTDMENRQRQQNESDRKYLHQDAEAPAEGSLTAGQGVDTGSAKRDVDSSQTSPVTLVPSSAFSRSPYLRHTTSERIMLG